MPIIDEDTPLEEVKKLVEEQDTGDSEEDLEVSLLISPEEIERRQKATQTRVREKSNDKVNKNGPRGNDDDASASKYPLRAGKVAVEFESGGRFFRNDKYPALKGSPEIGYFSDYNIKEVNDITLSREEDLFENIISILDTLNDDGWDIGDAMLEDLLEILVGMKLRFNTRKHKHRWLCDCQRDIPEQHRKMSEMEMDLGTIKYVNIHEVDEKLRAIVKKQLDRCSDDEYKNYLSLKYGPEYEYISKEDEIERIRIKEPIIVQASDGTVYRFAFTRVRHMIKGLRMANEKFNWKLRQIRSRYTLNSGMDEDARARVEDKYKNEIAKVENEKGKYGIMIIKALSLISKTTKLADGGTRTHTFEEDDEKLEEYERIPRSVMIGHAQFLNEFGFGIQDEREVKCNLENCGKTEKRLLQRILSPFELLPLDDDSGLDSNRELGLYSGVTILFDS